MIKYLISLLGPKGEVARKEAFIDEKLKFQISDDSF